VTARHVKLHLHTSPHLAPALSTPALMGQVTLALLPVVICAVWYFGVSALLVIGAATMGALATEWFFVPKHARAASLGDNSALLTGLLLGLTLPPSLPLWMAFVGGVVAIGLGKLIWGGLGHNLFNPALVGRAFLQAAFPVPLTTWVGQEGPAGFLTVHASTFALPLMQGKVDGISAATPLAQMKFEQLTPAVESMFFGETSGSLGETSALVIILCGLWLAWKRAFDWRIPVSIILSAFLLAGIFHAIDPAYYPAPWSMLLSGGLLLGAVFMATDPVSSPLAPRGAWVYGIGIGVLVISIRLFGGLPEGMMYSILLMNSATPLIERYLQPHPFGRRKRS
jgi:electron transport complex protein RnfD